MEREKEFFKALDRIAYFLAKRDHSKQELQQKLFGKFSEEAIQKAIDEAEEKNWILPPDEMSIKVTETLNLKRKGHLYIQNYLKKLGLPTTEMDDEREREKCLSLLESRYPNWQDLGYEEKQKPARFLQSRGFTLGIVKDVLFSL